MKIWHYLIGFILWSISLNAQQTMGLFQNSPQAFNGYTLFAPTISNNTYLIDNCGELVHSWTGSNRPALVVYLLENGDLLRTEKILNPVFNAGGSGGKILRLDWSGNIVWSYNYAAPTYHQHHDVEILPNGNILVLAWELRTNAEALAAGRNPALLDNNLWPERIVELQPIGTNAANIVWEWHTWDHLVQDFDSSKANYGVISEHPELINLNYAPLSGNRADWIHGNSLNYNPELDQIVISAHNFHEIWVIDHSTTTAEAASHSGGRSGKGGDLLYRWGNPAAYNRGLVSDQKLFVQHDAQWIANGLPDAGKIMIFNNGQGRPGGNYSSVDIINPPVDSAGNYQISPNQAFGPSNLFWTYFNNPSFYSSFISGANRLPNGNTLICEGDDGLIFEVDSDGILQWKYICPVGQGGALGQGNIPAQNDVFRAYRYAPDYGAFQGRNLTPNGPIEVNPLPSNCQIYSGNTSTNHPALNPNPIAAIYYQNRLEIDNPDLESLAIEVFNLNGQKLITFTSQDKYIEQTFDNLPNGLYLVRIIIPKLTYINTLKLVKS